MQGVLQALHPQAVGLHVSWHENLRGDQTPQEPVSVLPAAKVPSDGHALGLGAARAETDQGAVFG